MFFLPPKPDKTQWKKRTHPRVLFFVIIIILWAKREARRLGTFKSDWKASSRRAESGTGHKPLIKYDVYWGLTSGKIRAHLFRVRIIIVIGGANCYTLSRADHYRISAIESLHGREGDYGESFRGTGGRFGLKMAWRERGDLGPMMILSGCLLVNKFGRFGWGLGDRIRT